VIRQEATLTELWHSACDGLLFCKAEDLGYQSGATTGVFDCMLSTPSMEFDFDVGADLWLTKHRFAKLQKDYLDHDLTRAFVHKAASMTQNLAKRGTVTQMNTRVHGVQINQGGRKKDNYKWGNCIFGYSFRPALKERAVFSMHSRTSYISYMGGMDLALAYTLAKSIAELRGDDVREYGFRWMADSLQWYSIKSMAYIHTYDLVDEILNTKKWPDKKYPTVKITRNSYDFLHRRLEADNPPKYGPTLRMWSLMFETGTTRRPVSLPVDDLQLAVEL
jgi:hypothetical protein